MPETTISRAPRGKGTIPSSTSVVEGATTSTMTAFQKEATSKTSRWFYYVYSLEGDGDLRLIDREASH